MSLLISVGARLLGFLGGGFAGKVLDHLNRRGDRDAQITVEEIRAHMQARKATLVAEAHARQAARDIVMAEQGWWVTAMIRPAFAWPIVIWSGAIVADSLFHFNWDVAALPSPLNDWAGWIVGAYFLTRPLEKIARGFVHKKRGL